MPAPKGMTPKQDAFVKAYILNGGNGTQAALTAGYSSNRAQQMAAENVLKPVIREALDKHREKSEKTFEISVAKKKF